MDLTDEIRALAEQSLSDDKFVVEVLISRKKSPGRLLVIIDGDQGVTIDDCAALSRTLSKELDEKNYFDDDRYLLEVSTPGLDHPLVLRRQYYKNTGRKLKVMTKDSTHEGELKDVTDAGIVLLVQEKKTGKKKEVMEIGIPFSEIDKAFVQVSFK